MIALPENQQDDEVLLYNVLGEIVRQKVITEGQGQATMSLIHLPPGVYQLTNSTPNNSWTKKVLKL